LVHKASDDPVTVDTILYHLFHGFGNGKKYFIFWLQWKGGTSRQLPSLQLIHAEIDFNLRCGIADKANNFQGMKDITVLLLAIHHHLGMGFMVRRQDP